ncbi:hypothetical protein [Streptomyces tsukubensis]|uniref:hypothetical protein n=1 Tax=Streptomyces tsukubensis TaxID=83656 RepID=UPI0015C3E612|nr:hypothetical protein [Streptomyces tsukubensis]
MCGKVVLVWSPEGDVRGRTPARGAAIDGGRPRVEKEAGAGGRGLPTGESRRAGDGG